MIEIIFGDWCKINLDERFFLKQPVKLLWLILRESISMLLTMFALLDVLNLCLTACILFGTTVLEKEVVKMSPIEWVLVMLIFISSGVTILTMVVDKKGVIKKWIQIINFELVIMNITWLHSQFRLSIEKNKKNINDFA